MSLKLLVFGFITIMMSCVAAQKPQASDWATFKRWAHQHDKHYSPEELSYRYTVWADNVERINRLSAGNSNRGAASHTLGLTAHTDLTRDEFRARYLGAPMTPQDRLAHLQQPQQPSANTAAVEGWLRKAAGWLVHGPPHATQRHHQQAAVSKKQQKHWRYENVTAPTAVDWRKHQPPVLGAIKDQHVNGTPCGSCWAFSAVSIMEISSAMATGKVVLGSEQQLIDCDRKYDHGCSGGGWLNAIQYTIKQKGLATEADYPYTGRDGHCNKQLANAKHQLKVSSWEDVPFSNETALAQAVSQTPVIVAICVGPALDDWHHYAGGIYDSPCCEKEKQITLDHGIVVVGYGTENGTDFWVLKNSWGDKWGEQGFMRIKRNHGKHGKCALASYPAMVFRKPLPDGKPAWAQATTTVV